MVQNRRAGEQKSHWDRQDKQRKLPFQIMYVFSLSCPSATFALQLGGFVPREWLAAKGLSKACPWIPKSRYCMDSSHLVSGTWILDFNR